MKKIFYTSILGLVFLPFTAFAGITAQYDGSNLYVQPLPESGASFLFEGTDPTGEKDFRYGSGTYDANQFFVNAKYTLQWVPQEFLDCIDSIGTGSFLDYQNVCSGKGVTGYNPEYIIEIVDNTTWTNGQYYSSFLTSQSIVAIVFSAIEIIDTNILNIILISLGLALVFFGVRIIKNH